MEKISRDFFQKLENDQEREKKTLENVHGREKERFINTAHTEALEYNADFDKAGTEGTMGAKNEISNDSNELNELKEKLTTWMTIETGGKSREELMSELKEKGVKIGGYAKNILKSDEFYTSDKRELVEFVDASIANLGLKGNVKFDKIHERAFELGLDLCEAEDGPNLILQFSGPYEHNLAMKGIETSYGDSSVFKITTDWRNGKDNVPMLDSEFVSESTVYITPNNSFIFRRRRLKE